MNDHLTNGPLYQWQAQGVNKKVRECNINDMTAFQMTGFRDWRVFYQLTVPIYQRQGHFYVKIGIRPDV